MRHLSIDVVPPRTRRLVQEHVVAVRAVASTPIINIERFGAPCSQFRRPPIVVRQVLGAAAPPVVRDGSRYSLHHALGVFLVFGGAEVIINTPAVLARIRVDDGHVSQGRDRGAEVDALVLVGGHGDVFRAVGVLRGFANVAASYHVLFGILANRARAPGE